MKVMIPMKTKPVRQAWRKKNAADWPTSYVCNFLEPGLVSYEDVQAGIAMLSSDAIDKMLASMKGKPVIIDHQDVTPETFKKTAVGYVTRVWRDGVWAYCEFILTDDKAKELVARGYTVSCAYDVLGTGPGGEWHAIKFDEEITDGAFTHLALVTNPRYEACRIYQNSKGAGRLKDQAGNEVKHKVEGLAPEASTKKGVITMKIRKTINGKVEETEINPSEVYVAVGGKPVLLHSIINSKPFASEDVEVLDMTGAELVNDDGSTRTLENAVAEYQKNNGEKPAEDNKDNARKCSCSKAPKENAKPEDHEEECEMSKKNAVDDKEKENAGAADDKKNGKATVRDLRFFAKLNTQRENAAEVVSTGPQVDTRYDRIERGNARYGSKHKKQEAAAA